ncbi:response regulator [Cellulophaga baltica]|uniref:response regulator n=1 Tax=Cellulophaga TaxID=104264 RepID=UPI001C06951D|nr:MULTISPECIES: response regulator [Cellulophaga]MBU2995865.1 response regulator [Cellulophaga baltica]MDO6767260.1 response regulator [Cellulophaga sp. 1_MG-2023]
MHFNSIMLIDDSEIDNFIHKSVLEKFNITDTIITAKSGFDGIEKLKNLINDEAKKFPEIIFLDLCMPHMDGFGFLQEYMKFPEDIKASCSVYILSSSINPDDIKRAKKCPAVNRHLTKPLNKTLVDDIFNLKSV